jgi:CHAD domain-containing protein
VSASGPPGSPPVAPGLSPFTLLGRPPEEGARRLALAYLDQAVAARPRLDDPEDSEALHDFRVGLRRLRSTLRSYRPFLAEAVPKKLARRLRDLAGATGAGRDTEVQIEWLRDKGRHLGAYHRAGYAWLLEQLEERKAEAYEDILGEVAHELASLEKDLRKRLSVYRAEVHLGSAGPDHPEDTLARATAEILRTQVQELDEDLARIHGPDDEEQSHQARIAAKRLRYLLEPLADDLPAVKPVVKRIKALQDLLGELHDAHVLEKELAAFLEVAAIDRAKKLLSLTLKDSSDKALLRTERRRSREAGILALARLNRARRDRLHETLADQWLDGRGRPLLDDAEGLAVALEGGGGGTPEG